MKFFAIIVLSMLLISCNSANNSVQTSNNTQKADTSFETKEQISEKNPVIDYSKMSNKDILTIENHPRYFGSLSLSNTVWAPFKGDKVSVESSYNESSILLIESYLEDEDIITDIEIYFKEYSNSTNSVTLEEALELAKEYFPYDLIRENYTFFNSYKISPEDPYSDKDVAYVIQYSLTKKEDNLPGHIVLMLGGKDESSIEYLRFIIRLPKWTNFLERNGYLQEQWDFDFLSEV